MSYHNVRNSLGQFSSRPPRTKSSRPKEIVNGRLYDYRGATVRAVQLDNTGRRLVSFHKTLFGRVKDSDLNLVNRRKVNSYLEKA